MKKYLFVFLIFNCFFIHVNAQSSQDENKSIDTKIPFDLKITDLTIDSLFSFLNSNLPLLQEKTKEATMEFEKNLPMIKQELKNNLNEAKFEFQKAIVDIDKSFKELLSQFPISIEK